MATAVIAQGRQRWQRYSGGSGSGGNGDSDENATVAIAMAMTMACAMVAAAALAERTAETAVGKAKIAMVRAEVAARAMW